MNNYEDMALGAVGMRHFGVRAATAQPGSGSGKRTDIDRTPYYAAAAYVRSRSHMSSTREVMKRFGFRLSGGGREQFLRQLLELDNRIFSSDDDRWIGDWHKHYQEAER